MNRREFLGTKGCGLGDIRGMLEMKNLSGKCADLNALFVGLARAAGLPARDLYGLRVAPSAMFPNLGRAPLPFLMYPQAEAGGVRIDSLDPEHFNYTITAREL